jgi:hypothetical protein
LVILGLCQRVKQLPRREEAEVLGATLPVSFAEVGNVVRHEERSVRPPLFRANEPFANRALPVNCPVSRPGPVVFTAEPSRGRVRHMLVETYVAIFPLDVSVALVVEGRVDRRVGRVEQNRAPSFSDVKPFSVRARTLASRSDAIVTE